MSASSELPITPSTSNRALTLDFLAPPATLGEHASSCDVLLSRGSDDISDERAN